MNTSIIDSDANDATDEEETLAIHEHQIEELETDDEFFPSNIQEKNEKTIPIDSRGLYCLPCTE